MSNLPEYYDAIVIGAGIIGSSCGYHLAKSGQKTLVFEQFVLGHHNGSSHGGSRIIRHAHSQEVYMPLSFDAFRQWNELEAAFGEKLYLRNGLIWLSDVEEDTLERVSLLDKYSVPYQILRGKEISRHFAHLTYDDKWTALYEPSGGTMLANKCLDALQSLIAIHGGHIRANTRIAQLLPSGDRVVVVTEGGTKFVAAKVVVSAGAWLNGLVAGLPLNAAPQAIAVTFYDIEPAAQPLYLPETPNLIVTGTEDIFFMIANVDYPNKIKFGNHWGVKCDPSALAAKRAAGQQSDACAPRAVYEMLSKHIGAHLPNVNGERPSVEYTCLYAVTNDENFIIDRHPKYENVIIAGGMSGTGFKFAPTIGDIVKNLVIGRPVGFDLSAFRLDRKIVGACKL